MEIIEKLNRGEKLINLTKEYGVGYTVIYDIRKNRVKIECFMKNTDSGLSDRQNVKSGEYPGHQSEEQLKSRDGLIEVIFYCQTEPHFHNQWVRMLYNL